MAVAATARVPTCLPETQTRGIPSCSRPVACSCEVRGARMQSAASRLVSRRRPAAAAGRTARRRQALVRAAAIEENAAGAGGDSVVAEVASLPEAEETEGVASKGRKPSPLERGGTLKGAKAEGKEPSLATLGKTSKASMGSGEKFSDSRWKNGTWDITMFTAGGKVNWDAVIDAEVVRRKWLEENPESSTNEDPVVFDTSTVPWWAWVRRFHLPEAEKVNGRAAMVGYAMGYLVDSATGVGLVDQSSGFIGKLLILITVLGVMLVRKNEDLANLKNLADEWTFYDRQWQATWKEGPPRSASEAKPKE